MDIPPDKFGPMGAEIRSGLAEHFRLLGLPNGTEGHPQLSKVSIREMHRAHRAEVLRSRKELLISHADDLEAAMAVGSDVDPEHLSPVLVPVKADSDESVVFRLASLYWSVPVSNGYGRRMRLLVKDRRNGKLIGLIALTDPVFNLKARDEWIGWSSADRMDRLRLVMDACVLGALPPYSYLIGGKLVAALAASNEAREVFRQRYKHSQSEILKRRSNTELVLLTTTSALGKSSVYDRLRIEKKVQFIPVGETKGYGHFHIPEDLFAKMRTYLEALGHPYANGYRFGQGPNWRLRVIREAMKRIGQDPEMLRHGITREVYVVPLAHNALKVLAGAIKKVRPISAKASEISTYCKARWMIPRARRDERYLSFRPEEFVSGLVREVSVRR